MILGLNEISQMNARKPAVLTAAGRWLFAGIGVFWIIVCAGAGLSVWQRCGIKLPAIERREVRVNVDSGIGDLVRFQADRAAASKVAKK